MMDKMKKGGTFASDKWREPSSKYKNESLA